MGKATDVGAAATSPGSEFIGNGYDLYSTTPVGDSNGTVQSGAFSAGTRLSRFPSYISTIAANGANTSAAAYGYATLDNPTGGTVQSGLCTRDDSISTEKSLLAINFTGSPAPAVYLGVIINTSGNSFVDYPSNLEVSQSAGGPGDSGVIATGPPNPPAGIDVFVFEITGAMAGDQFTVSGTEPGINGSTYNLAVAGLTFAPTNPVPEPASVAISALALMPLAHRKRLDCSGRERSI
ncbi:MAG TPA: hypothetical protein VN541_18180 [Tepidisphaeraceae bacterium]|nr:hypothetical protein [Tepidisphaeraceae bacterium]